MNIWDKQRRSRILNERKRVVTDIRYLSVLEIMNKELNEIIVLLKEIKQLLESRNPSYLKYQGPTKTKAANRPKY